MQTEIIRHNDILARLSVKRLDLEKKWFHVDQETPVTIVENMLFEMRCLDIMLYRMIGRARLITPETEEYTHRALNMVWVVLTMERESYSVNEIESKYIA